MGKHFKGVHADKQVAKLYANHYAQHYRKGKCYTPANNKSCTFDENTKLWTCVARAHHHLGSCGGGECGCCRAGNDLKSSEVLNDEVYTDASPEDYVELQD